MPASHRKFNNSYDGRRGPRAVSYTHLDVYKRQFVYRPELQISQDLSFLVKIG